MSMCIGEKESITVSIVAQKKHNRIVVWRIKYRTKSGDEIIVTEGFYPCETS